MNLFEQVLLVGVCIVQILLLLLRLLQVRNNLKNFLVAVLNFLLLELVINFLVQHQVRKPNDAPPQHLLRLLVQLDRQIIRHRGRALRVKSASIIVGKDGALLPFFLFPVQLGELVVGALLPLAAHVDVVDVVFKVLTLGILGVLGFVIVTVF